MYDAHCIPERTLHLYILHGHPAGTSTSFCRAPIGSCTNTSITCCATLCFSSSPGFDAVACGVSVSAERNMGTSRAAEDIGRIEMSALPMSPPTWHETVPAVQFTTVSRLIGMVQVQGSRPQRTLRVIRHITMICVCLVQHP